MYLISCETGGRRVPAYWSSVSEKQDQHDGDVVQPSRRMVTSDASGRYAARRLAENLGAPLIENEYSLDCVDVTRSIRHPQLFSGSARQLDAKQRARLLDQIYYPYRERLRRTIMEGLKDSPILIHLSVRSFAASSKGHMRRTDVGLLYDPSREDEVDFCLDWIEDLYEIAPMLRVRRNYPKRGTQDSMTRAMRAEFSDQPYVGIELAINRAWASRPLRIRDEAIDGLSESLLEIFRLPSLEAA
jgi:predicted N-formylglutamate amidohydrolase